MFRAVFTKGHRDKNGVHRMERGRFGLVIVNESDRMALCEIEINGVTLCDIVLPVGSTFLERSPVNGKRMYFDGYPTHLKLNIRKALPPDHNVSFETNQYNVYKLVSGEWLSWMGMDVQEEAFVIEAEVKLTTDRSGE